MAVNRPNILQYAAKQLSKEIHNKIADEIVNNLINDFHKRIRPVVEEEVNKIAINIETYEDFEKMVSELKVICEFR